MRQAFAGRPARWVPAAFVLFSAVLHGGCPRADSDSPAPRVSLVLVAEGLTAPVALAAPSDGTGRLFVATQPGTIEIISQDGGVSATPLLDIRDRVVPLLPAYDERGLLGLALHPQFAQNGRLFVFYNGPATEGVENALNSEVRVSEFRVQPDDPNRADAAGERVLLRIGKPQGNHNGGQLAFGPDGLLYVGVGDGGGAGDAAAGHTPGIGNAQDLSNLLGKILRIDVDADEPYGIPADNPFVPVAGARPEIYAFGLRNPWRFSFDVPPQGSPRLFAGDVGQGRVEEVDLITAGGNYGWRIREGATCYDLQDPAVALPDCARVDASGRPLIDPILSYTHATGVSVIGGFVYRGGSAASLVGKYVFGDWSASVLVPSGLLFVATEGADGWSFERLTIDGRPDGTLGEYLLAFGQDAAGELYLLTNRLAGPAERAGAVWRVSEARP